MISTKYILPPVLYLTLHWLLVRFYAWFCVPASFTGYLTSFMTTGSPICSFSLSLMERTSHMYFSSWVYALYVVIDLLVGQRKKLKKQ